MDPNATPFLSVLIPAYNEEASVERVIIDHAQLLGTNPDLTPRWEILCLDDGSTDRTGSILRGLADHVENLRVLQHGRNQGIAASLADLYAAARGTHIFATAADGQWPATNLSRMYTALNSGAHLVVGVRLNRHEVYTFRRRMISTLYNLLTRLALGVETQDAGSIKLGVRELFTAKVISRSPFAEAELILLAQRRGCRIAFVPIEFLPRASGKAGGASWKNVLASLRDVVRCVRAYGFRSRPGRPGASRDGDGR